MKSIQIGRNIFKPITKGQKVEEPGFAGGWYRQGRNVYFTQFDGVDRVCLVSNKHTSTTGPFFVTCRPEPSSPTGRWYGHATSTPDAEWLGVDKMGDREERKTAYRIAVEVGVLTGDEQALAWLRGDIATLEPA